MKEIPVERILQNISFARMYVHEYNHGANGHIDYHTITYLSEQLDKLQEDLKIAAERAIKLHDEVARYRAPVEVDGYITSFNISYTDDLYDRSDDLSIWKSERHNAPTIDLNISSNDIYLAHWSMRELRSATRWFVQIKPAVKHGT